MVKSDQDDGDYFFSWYDMIVIMMVVMVSCGDDDGEL